MDVSIIIPTKNGGELFEQVLKKIFEQKTRYEYEVICVDSGSSDNTIEIIKKFPCRLYQILPEEFGHGKTRNYGASKGTGEFIIFITQDALPVDEYWLENFIDAMKIDEEVVGGFGIHKPYPECNVLDQRDITLHFKGFGDKNTIYYMDDPVRYETEEGYRHFLAFFSDNNACLRRSAWEKYPYPDVNFSEDQIWAKQMIELGYKKIYCPTAAVYHSHNYPLKTYFKRYYDQYKAIYQIHKYQMYTSLKGMIHGMLYLVGRDLKYIWNPKNKISHKLKWSHYAWVRNRYQSIAGYIGGCYHAFPESVKKYFDERISQQYDQIYDNDGEKQRMSDKKTFLKWLFIDPDHLDKNGDILWEKKASVFGGIDVIGQYHFAIKQQRASFDVKAYENAKNSKKICLSDRKWKLFKMKDIITDIHNGKSYNASDLVISDTEDYVPYVTRTDENNGISLCVEEKEYVGLEKGKAITIGDTTSTIFYQQFDFITGPHIIVIRADWFNVYTASFLISLLNMEKYRYPVFGRAFSKELIQETVIPLPVNKNGEPDYEFMANYMQSLPYSSNI